MNTKEYRKIKGLLDAGFAIKDICYYLDVSEYDVEAVIKDIAKRVQQKPRRLK